MSGRPNYGKPKKTMMDDDDGPSRKVAPGGAGISFAPMQTGQFNAAQFSSVSSPYDMSAMQSTQTQKARAAGYGAGVAPTTQAFRWKLAEIPVLPEFHPLERTAVFVEDSTPAEVSSRISTILRQRSIEASYDDEKAKVRCVSPSGVDFRIRLYHGRGEYSNGIIVEVQRRFGHAVDFHNDTNAILNAAEGLPTPPPPPLRSAGDSALPMVSDSEDDYVPSSSGASSLQMISKMFGHAGYDSYYLALQTLASLTDASKMGMVTAKNVSLELLKPDNDVGSKLIDFVVSKKTEDVFGLQVMALTILANALTAAKGQIPEVSREALRPALLKELEQASASNLLAAQQAARCVEYTWKGDHDVGELQAALETAKAVGTARHSGLEQQAKATLSRMVY